MRAILSYYSLLFPILAVHASVTIYTQVAFGPGGPTQSVPAYVKSPAHYDLATAQPPAPTSPANPTFVVQLQSAPLPGLSKAIDGCHMGFSIELSVADQVGTPSFFFKFPLILNRSFLRRSSITVGTNG